MKISISPFKFSMQGLKVGIGTALYSSLILSLTFSIYGLFTNPDSLSLDSENLSYIILSFAFSITFFSLASLVPCVVAGLILSRWVYSDLERGRFSDRSTRIKGALLGFIFSLGIFAIVVWGYINFPAHNGILPAGGVKTVIMGYARTVIVGTSIATWGGTWAGSRLAKFAQRNQIPQ
jgi:magnesium-transporting ATPase (P-type)